MTVCEMAASLSLTALALPDPDRCVEGAYIGDLLSWVMGRAQSGHAWVTIMSNRNILAVATLSDVACILLCEGVLPDEGVTEMAVEKDINILTSPLPAYELARELARIGL